MKEKERLLSMDEPLRFIFTHSALREGWDNPNVFQICTLNETRSSLKKRQEIGRGLRLPVDQSGFRVRDESVNKLCVMANESYEIFARALQTEYEEDCGVTFGKVPLTAIAKLIHLMDGQEQPIGRAAADEIRTALVTQKILDSEGRIKPAFNPRQAGFKLTLPDVPAYRNEVTGKPLKKPAGNLSILVYERIETICNWRLGQSSMLDEKRANHCPYPSL